MKTGDASAREGRRSGGLVQFIKYAICGGLATGVDILAFFVLAIYVLQAVQPDDPMLVLLRRGYEEITAFLPSWKDAAWLQALLRPDLPAMPESRRLTMFIVDKTLAFLVSNFTAYVTNVRWVFQSGRHSRRKELGLFYAVSGVSYLVGMGMAWLLIDRFSLPSSLTYGALLVASVMINFVCRKFLIFKG